LDCGDLFATSVEQQQIKNAAKMSPKISVGADTNFGAFEVPISVTLPEKPWECPFCGSGDDGDGRRPGT